MAGLRLERQHLLRPADETAYEALYRDLQPGLNVYWCGFGQPPTLSFRAAFDDLSYNRERQRRRELLKGRFQGAFTASRWNGSATGSGPFWSCWSERGR